MRQLRAGGKLRVLAFGVGLLACATRSRTQLTSEHFEPVPPGGKLHKVATMGLTNNPEVRRAFENDMAARLQKRGTAAVPAYEVVPGGLPSEREELRNALERAGVDGLIVARLVGKSTREEVVGSTTVGGPTYVGAHGFYGYYTYAYPSYTVPVTETRTVVTIDLRLFSVAGDGQLLWSAQSQTIDPQKVGELIADVDEATAAALARGGYI